VAILGTFARVLNRHIGASTAAQQRVAALEGRSLAIEIEGLSLSLAMRVAGGRVELGSVEDSPADATLKGAPLALLGLLEVDSLSRLRAGRVELAGDVHVAEAFAEMLRFARPDFEEEIAPWIGDIAAHQIGTVLRGLTTWTRRAGRALEADVAEYLQEEGTWLPAALEARAFYADVERLRDDVERTAARLEKIVRKAADS
jgi:ubiquinone biosynthesis protein UbiJ